MIGDISSRPLILGLCSKGTQEIVSDSIKTLSAPPPGQILHPAEDIKAGLSLRAAWSWVKIGRLANEMAHQLAQWVVKVACVAYSGNRPVGQLPPFFGQAQVGLGFSKDANKIGFSALD